MAICGNEVEKFLLSKSWSLQNTAEILFNSSKENFNKKVRADDAKFIFEGRVYVAGFEVQSFAIFVAKVFHAHIGLQQ